MSDLYNSILSLIRQNGYREFEKEYMNVMEYMRDEARYILGMNDDKKITICDKSMKEKNDIEEKKDVVNVEILTDVKNDIEDNIEDNIKVLEIKEDKKEEKKTQRVKEKECRERLKREGVKVEEIFTLENIRSWLEEGRSYAWISSERLGCRQEEVSRFAKRHGLDK